MQADLLFFKPNPEASKNRAKMATSLSSHFPLTVPTPSILTTPDLVPLSELALELDLIRSGSTNFSRWIHYINNVEATTLQAELDARGTASDQETALLGQRLSTPAGRKGLQRLTDLYERALSHFPTSYKLWKQYLDMRCSYVLGKPKLQVNLKAPKKKRGSGEDADEIGGTELLLKYLNEGVKDPESGDVGEELTENERDVDAQWEGGLDGVIGAQEWRALAGTFERAIMWLPRVSDGVQVNLAMRLRLNDPFHAQMPRIWLNYLNTFLHPSCPSFLIHTHARRSFDRALRVLAKPLHERVWRIYLKYAQDVAVPQVSSFIFRRYIKVDVSATEHYVKLLLAGNPSGTTRPLEAAKLMLRLTRLASDGKYKSPNGKGPYNLLIDWLEIVEKYAEDIGISDEEAQELKQEYEQQQTGQASGNANDSTADGLMRFAGPPTIVDAQHRADERAAGELEARREAEEYMDSTDPKRLDVEDIIRRDGLAIYKDQAGRLWNGLATYWIKMGDFDKARSTFEEGMASVMTVRDFTQVFDTYAEFYESSISALMDAVADEEEGSEEAKETEAELDQQMKDFEDLMDRRPFLVNDVLLRRNPNDVQEWEKRVALWGTNDDEVSVHL
jgi:pre-mRNA-splicing factor SYF1